MGVKSPMYDFTKMMWEKGFYTEDQIKMFARPEVGFLTPEEAAIILSTPQKI